MGKKNRIRIRIRIRILDDQPGSYFRELRNQFFCVKILNLFDGYGIRDGKNSDPDGKHSAVIKIPDPQQ
jgi:hypothetical protein